MASQTLKIVNNGKAIINIEQPSAGTNLQGEKRVAVFDVYPKNSGGNYKTKFKFDSLEGKLYKATNKDWEKVAWEEVNDTNKPDYVSFDSDGSITINTMNGMLSSKYYTDSSLTQEFVLNSKFNKFISCEENDAGFQLVFEGEDNDKDETPNLEITIAKTYGVLNLSNKDSSIEIYFLPIGNDKFVELEHSKSKGGIGDYVLKYINGQPNIVSKDEISLSNISYITEFTFISKDLIQKFREEIAKFLEKEMAPAIDPVQTQSPQPELQQSAVSAPSADSEIVEKPVNGATTLAPQPQVTTPSLDLPPATTIVVPAPQQESQQPLASAAVPLQHTEQLAKLADSPPATKSQPQQPEDNIPNSNSKIQVFVKRIIEKVDIDGKAFGPRFIAEKPDDQDKLKTFLEDKLNTILGEISQDPQLKSKFDSLINAEAKEQDKAISTILQSLYTQGTFDEKNASYKHLGDASQAQGFAWLKEAILKIVSSIMVYCNLDKDGEHAKRIQARTEVIIGDFDGFKKSIEQSPDDNKSLKNVVKTNVEKWADKVTKQEQSNGQASARQ